MTRRSARGHRPTDIRPEIESSPEVTTMLDWLTDLQLGLVTMTVDCGPSETDATVNVSYSFKLVPVQVTTESESEPLRDALIRSACESEEGRQLMEALARRIGVDSESVQTELTLIMAERLPVELEDLHDAAKALVLPDLTSPNMMAALIGRLLVMHPGVDDEFVLEVLKHRAVKEVMTE